MERGGLGLTITNPHGTDIARLLLAILLRQAGIAREQWERG